MLERKSINGKDNGEIGISKEFNVEWGCQIQIFGENSKFSIMGNYFHNETPFQNEKMFQNEKAFQYETVSWHFPKMKIPKMKTSAKMEKPHGR